MLKTWTDTHYKLDDGDWLYLAKNESDRSVSLVCPGYARDGQGFSIHFSCAQLEILQQLVGVLQTIQSQSIGGAAASDPSQIVPFSPAGDSYQYPHQTAVGSNQKLLTYPLGREK